MSAETKRGVQIRTHDGERANSCARDDAIGGKDHIQNGAHFIWHSRRDGRHSSMDITRASPQRSHQTSQHYPARMASTHLAQSFIPPNGATDCCVNSIVVHVSILFSPHIRIIWCICRANRGAKRCIPPSHASTRLLRGLIGVVAALLQGLFVLEILRVELVFVCKSKHVLLRFIRDGGCSREHMEAIVGDAKYILAIILNAVLVSHVDHIVRHRRLKPKFRQFEPPRKPINRFQSTIVRYGFPRWLPVPARGV